MDTEDEVGLEDEEEDEVDMDGPEVRYGESGVDERGKMFGERADVLDAPDVTVLTP